ncbi:aminoglycoside phosphotransferase family protein [Mycolicibacterium tusciae]|uniref:aminoglycoside phosphotransferase family protein n=1 Tax=Mycolicibacterium tusciae TaxID=75922 RepID=UPI00024A323E|nr:aminoglycoside phosphotransferase family protein [Mycolicibacterium tusciae]
MTDLDDLVIEWDLCPDGPAIDTEGSRLMPVRADSAPAVLKIGASEHAHLVLRRWNGRGAVRLLRADPHRRALLLERLGTTNLVPDDDACTVIADLYRRLHVPAMPQLPSAATLTEQWAEDFDALPRSAPIPHRLVEQAATLCRDLATAPADTTLHGNLHCGKVLAAEREPWLAIAPQPLNGDPPFELAPMLWTGWDDGPNRDDVRHRFYTLVDAAGFDEDRAKAWAIVRIVRAAVNALDHPGQLTQLITIAKAIQD